MKNKFWLLAIICNLVLGIWNFNLYAGEIKEPNVTGAFYPADKERLSATVDSLLDSVNPEAVKGEIFALICPHAGYTYSGRTAAYAYKLVKNKPYKTVIVIGTSHRYGFPGISIYPSGSFRTPLGEIEIDKEFSAKLLNKNEIIYFEPRAFAEEHSVEVQLPFVQRALPGAKIVAVVMGDCSLETCDKFVAVLNEAIAGRNDVLLVASSDMYHGEDYEECELVDAATVSYLKNMDAQGLYYGLREGKLQMCGGWPAVTVIMLAKELGHDKLVVLDRTNSAVVTGRKMKGEWTVGYVSCAIDQEKGETAMLNDEQRKKLLKLARNSIETYLKTGEELAVTESDPVLTKVMGAFVTLSENGELRGCIGNIVGQQPLYLTVKNMAVAAAVSDPRFRPVRITDLKKIGIEISVLSPLVRVGSAEEIILGKHGVVVKRGSNSGVFLPQVATETGWTKEEFLSSLCSHKAGLPADAWKDPATELYTFSAEVFSEKE
ncbi:MAG: AmmeMemoRadiSam system protein B [Candidatus Omnitrophota bacterium]